MRAKSFLQKKKKNIYIYIFIYKKNYTRYSRNVAQEIDKRIEINHIAT